jgi:hypothetical protein
VPPGCAALRGFTSDGCAYACSYPELKRRRGRRLGEVEMPQEPAVFDFHKRPPRHLDTHITSYSIYKHYIAIYAALTYKGPKR